MFNKQKRVILYTRVSTHRQDTINQLEELRRIAAFNQWEELYHFTDTQTGKNTRRPGFQAMLDTIRTKNIDILAVWSLDRLGRNARDILNFMEDELIPRRITFYSAKENVDTSTPMGKFCLTIMASFAQMELERISERIIAGQRTALLKGKKLGRKSKVISTPDFQERLMTMFHQGVSIRKMARELGCNPMTVQKYLKLSHTMQESESDNDSTLLS